MRPPLWGATIGMLSRMDGFARLDAAVMGSCEAIQSESSSAVLRSLLTVTTTVPMGFGHKILSYINHINNRRESHCPFFYIKSKKIIGDIELGSNASFINLIE